MLAATTKYSSASGTNQQNTTSAAGAKNSFQQSASKPKGTTYTILVFNNIDIEIGQEYEYEIDETKGMESSG